MASARHLRARPVHRGRARHSVRLLPAEARGQLPARLHALPHRAPHGRGCRAPLGHGRSPRRDAHGPHLAEPRRGQPAEDEEQPAHPHTATRGGQSAAGRAAAACDTRLIRVHHPTGLPLDTDRFVELRWHRALRATGIRPRKFYATRHTFILVALSRGCSAKWVAKYCGTSLEMLDVHYGRWMNDDQGQLDLLAPSDPKTRGGGRKPGPKPGPNQVAAASTRSGKRRG